MTDLAPVAPVFRRFCTGVSFTVCETMYKTEKDGDAVVAWETVQASQPIEFPAHRQASLSFISFDNSKHQKVIYDGLHHFERDIDKNMLSSFGMQQTGDWTAHEVPSPELGNLVWIPPTYCSDGTHMIVLPIGPTPVFAILAGHLNKPIVAPVHSAFLVPKNTTALLVASEQKSVILTRGATRRNDVELG